MLNEYKCPIFSLNESEILTVTFFLSFNIYY